MNIIRIAEQFQYFEQYQQRLAELIGEEQAIKRVKGALVLITLGGNDFVNNYFLLPVTARRLQYPNLSDYVNFVIREYQKVLYVSFIKLNYIYRNNINSIKNFTNQKFHNMIFWGEIRILS